MQLALLSNVNVEILGQSLTKCGKVYLPAGYGIWLQELLDSKSGLFASSPAALFCILDARELLRGKYGYDECIKELENIESVFAKTLAKHSKCLFFISNFDYPDENARAYKEVSWHKAIEFAWYRTVQNLCAAFSNCYMLDLKSLVEECGRVNFYSAKMWYLGGCRFSLKANFLFEKSIIKIMEAYQGSAKKCLLLDLDNTLWGGIVGEQGFNIELAEFKEGARYKDFQRVIKSLKNMGIVLGIVSKNNPEDALEVIRKHEHMVLREDDFVIKKINWASKTENIRQAAAELNIGLDAIVFIDDNPVEREQVKNLLPEVTVPEFPVDTAQLPKFMREVWQNYFLKLDLTEEDKGKTLQYQQNAKRQQAMSSIQNVDDFLRSLDTTVTIWQARAEDVERVVQLIQKTNQFNFTTKRYTMEQIQAMMDATDYEVWVGAVTDKFGDNGKVIVWIIHYVGDRAELDSFLMSCRVMGRRLEEQILDFIETSLNDKGVKRLRTFYYPTKKNAPVQELFTTMGYTKLWVDEKGNTDYEIALPAAKRSCAYAALQIL